MAASPHILVVDDDREIRDLVSRLLKKEGLRVSTAADGVQMHRELASGNIDLIVLDLMLPGDDGLTLCRQLRATSAIPIIMLTAKGDEFDRVLGLEMGADDYVTKPFQMEELLARLRALIRRSAGHASAEIFCGPVSIDTRSGRVSAEGVVIKLTAQEYKILSYLMHHQDKVVSRTELTEHVYDQDFDRDSNTIEVFIGRLRKKLGVDVIRTERGLGYRMVASDNAA